MTPAGYSGTPLAKKLGIAAGSRVVTRSAPANYAELVNPLPDDVAFDTKITSATDIVHLFVERKALLAKQLAELRKQLRGDAVVWVSWPKKASGVPTDITEDGIREVALPLGWVDVKVCAVDAVWSGLKLVVRRELR
ncbi:MAG TPA: DUF3052 domain-containing protein [Casimicrobiaceae bacterium]|nr:DUF3052 domain-containing protein [Casimicrobiaceae bacterium]